MSYEEAGKLGSKEVGKPESLGVVKGENREAVDVGMAEPGYVVRTHPRFLASQVGVVLTKELRGRARGWRLFAVLTGYLCALGVPFLIVYLAIGGLDLYQRRSAGQGVLIATLGFQLALVCLIAPALTAGAIAGERERQTYDLLMTTPLSSAAIVLGKLLGALAYLLLLVTAALPLQGAALWLGGVSPEEVGIGLAMTLVVALTYGAVGIFFSTLIRSAVAATVLSYLFILLAAGAVPGTWGVGLLLISRMGQATPAWISDPAPWFLYATGILLSLNPIAAGVLTEAFLLGGRSAVFFWETVGRTKLFIVSPWLVFSALNLAAAGALIMAAVRRVRDTGGGGK